MTTQEIRVNDWDDLLESLYRDDKNVSLNRYRSTYVYRGLESVNYDLSTSLRRLGQLHLEKHLLRNFIKYSQIDDANKSIWNWMAIAQHHGLPTRLLDWTYSPLVALHFATGNFEKFKEDGVVWALNYQDALNYVPAEFMTLHKAEGSYVFTAEMLDKVASSLEQLEQLKKDEYAVFFEPPSIDDRIVNQFGLFSMMSKTDQEID